jgi:hypothetical protein
LGAEAYVLVGAVDPGRVDHLTGPAARGVLPGQKRHILRNAKETGWFMPSVMVLLRPWSIPGGAVGEDHGLRFA